MAGSTRGSGGGRTTRRRPIRLTAALLAAGVAAGALVASGGSARAASLLQAQSVGRFLDGSAGGAAIQTLADLTDARATSPGEMTTQNPLELNLGGQGTAPLGDALQLPGGGIAELGAADQLATAGTDGAALGASGAVANSGGAQASNDSSTYPANATINLSAAAVGSVRIPGLDRVPGIRRRSTNLAALGGVQAEIGAISALARTRAGGEVVTPTSSVADLKLTVSSPAIVALLKQLKAILDPATLTAVLSQITGSGLPAGVALPSSFGDDCALTAASPTDPISLDGSAVVLDPTSAKITVDVGKLVSKVLNKDISNLETSNFDVTAFLAKNLPKILATGLGDTVDGIISPLRDQFAACITAAGKLTASSLVGTLRTDTAIATVISTLTTNLKTGRKTLIGTIAGIRDQFSTAAETLVAALEQVVTIGLNVQHGPGIEPWEKKYPFSSDLNATPDQATGVVAHQTIVRALELDLLDTSGLPDPRLGELPSAVQRNASKTTLKPAAAAASAAVLALGNAGAAPSTPLVAAATPIQSVAPIVTIPTAVPAGAAGHDAGSPLLPIAVILLALVAASAGVTRTLRTRGRPGRS